MCGIVGFFSTNAQPCGPFSTADRRRVLRSLEHRGPDAEGEYLDPEHRCWLGFRRLAIIDLETGDQPMRNEDGTIWLVFNGEIYNYLTLRERLIAEGHAFRTKSDSEVIIHGFEQWGLKELVQQLRGIFAFALYDESERRIYLARDHLGVKPLFMSYADGVLSFASEIKALLEFPWSAPRRVNIDGVAQFLTCRYVSRPRTMFQGIEKLPEATFTSIGATDSRPLDPHRYWRPSFRDIDTHESFDDSVERLDMLLAEAVQLQLMSDVPVGAQLSGGVDSSLVVAYMQSSRQEFGQREPIHTYSVGFDIPGYSELPYAEMVASRWNTVHHEITVSSSDFLREFAHLAWIYDEPMGEPPAIPTYLMCKRAKEDVTVMLCGEGADEQFGGYNKYVFEGYSKYLDWLPPSMRGPLLKTPAALLPFRSRRLRAILEILAISDVAKRYASWYGAFDSWTQSAILDPVLRDTLGDALVFNSLESIIAEYDGSSDLGRFQYCDIHTRLVDDLLVKGDRMSMAASVEARVPFLDHRVVEFAAGLPSDYHVRGIRAKRALKTLAERYVPHSAIRRRKVGFTVPLTRWFVQSWSSLLREMLLSERALSRGYFRPDVVHSIVEDHLERRVDREQGIWVLLALEMWHRIFIDDDGSRDAALRVQDGLGLGDRL